MSFGLASIVDAQNAKNKRRFSLLMLEEREYYFQVSRTGSRQARSFSTRWGLHLLTFPLLCVPTAVPAAGLRRLHARG